MNNKLKAKVDRAWDLRGACVSVRPLLMPAWFRSRRPPISTPLPISVFHSPIVKRAICFPNPIRSIPPIHPPRSSQADKTDSVCVVTLCSKNRVTHRVVHCSSLSCRGLFSLTPSAGQKRCVDPSDFLGTDQRTTGNIFPHPEKSVTLK